MTARQTGVNCLTDLTSEVLGLAKPRPAIGLIDSPRGESLGRPAMATIAANIPATKPGEGREMAKRATEAADGPISPDQTLNTLIWAAKKGNVFYAITVSGLLLWQVLVPAYERLSTATLKVREAEITEKLAMASAMKEQAEAGRELKAGMDQMVSSVNAMRLTSEALINELKTHFRAGLAEDPHKVAEAN